MKIVKINPNNPEPHLLQEAADVILNNGVIGYPTETVYGLGANALSNIAIQKIFLLKQRDKNKPILIIAYSLEQIKKLVAFFPEIAKSLAYSFWPGPLTIIFNAATHLDKQLIGDGNSIGIRIPDNKICLELLRLCGVPLTSTSANVTGGKNPININEILNTFGDKLDLIIDGGVSQSRTPSTVLDLSEDKPILRREGVITKNEIEHIIGFKIDENKTEK